MNDGVKTSQRNDYWHCIRSIMIMKFSACLTSFLANLCNQVGLQPQRPHRVVVSMTCSGLGKTDNVWDDQRTA